MNSSLYVGELGHHRLSPVEHRFCYPVSGCAVDVDELPSLDRQVAGFGYNRFAPWALHDRDYLDHGTDPLRSKVRRVLEAQGLAIVPDRIVLVTAARFFGHAFNPASFYFCYSNDELACVLAEVSNTFGERHAYVLEDPVLDSWDNRVAKAFFVSPFNAVDGDYQFRFADPRREIDIRMRLVRGEGTAFQSWLRGALRPLATFELARALVRNPWTTLPRIHWEAAMLYFKKRLPLVQKQRPTHVGTLRADPPTVVHRFSREVVRRFLNRDALVGTLTFDMADGRRWTFGSGAPFAELRVQNYDLFPRLLVDGDVALGDGYMHGEWDSSDPTAVVRFFVDNRERLDDKQLFVARWGSRALRRGAHALRANTLAGSQRNIAAHYDLGNRLYQSFLDPTMSYSCGYYASAGDDLEKAQRNKIGRLLARARLGPHDHLLEIGCGWGALAIEAARTYGCRVTGLTLSQQQHEWAYRRVREEGLEHLIELRRCDYRQVQGTFTRIISCEMLEAVGHENLPIYFAQLERLLAEDGLVVLQAITVPDHSYESYRRECDWIQKQIFPGATIPSLTALLKAMSTHSQLRLEAMDNIGPHYARTLRDWRERFIANWPQLREHYDGRFRRAWIYYLSYCEAAFASLNLGDLQMTLARPKNAVLRHEVPAWL